MPVAPVNGIKLNYRVCGRGDPLVLIMGLAGPRMAWTFQERAFGSHFRVVTYDSRGVGSTSDGGQPFTIRTLAEDARALLDYLRIDRAHVLGYSLGGIVAQELAIRFPERVNKLILVATTPVGPEFVPVSSGRIEALTTAGQSVVPSTAHAATLAVDTTHLMPTLIDLAFSRPAFRALVRSLAGLYVRRSDPAGWGRQMQSVVGANTWDGLPSIQIPTLVLVGSDDRVILPSASAVLADRIPGARLVTIEGGSHALAYEMGRRFNREVLAFLCDRPDSDPFPPGERKSEEER